MSKQSFSIAPWSIILSLYLLPTQYSFAEEDASDVPVDVDSPEDASTVDDVDVDDVNVEPGTDQESAEQNPTGQGSDDVVSEPSDVEDVEDVEVVPSEDATQEAGFDPNRQLASNNGVLAPSVQDIAAFKQSYKRYRSRINEFREETLSMVEIQRQEAFDLLREQYTEPVAKLKEQQVQQRTTAIERFERFIEKYPESPEGAGIRFQLADIYFKIAEEEFLSVQEEIAVKMDENPDLEIVVMKDLNRAFELYREIVELFPNADVLDGALYMMGWCYSDAESDLYDADKSAEFYKRVIEDHPESRFVAQANYFVGQYYFNLNDNETALTYFDSATSLSKPEPGEFNSLYEYANYRLAWTHYLLNEYDRALELFTLHQDYSQRKLVQTGNPSNTLEESFEYTALSFADIAELEGKDAVEIAQEYYDSIGEREYTADVLVYLAEELIEQVRIVEAADTYQYLQDRWPYAPENPTYQKKLAELWLNEGEVELYMDEMKILTDRYAENGEWWVQNRNNPEAQDIARGYVEASLLDVAYNQFNRAYESMEPADFLSAVESFDRFLNRFPFAEEYYDAMWYMADALMNAGEIVRALEEYRELVKTAPDHQRGELAQLKVLNITNGQARNHLMGNFEMLPDDAVVKETRELPNGDTLDVFELPEVGQSFIQAYLSSASLDYETRLLRIEEEMGQLQRQATEDSDRQIQSLQSIIEEINGAKVFFDESLKTYQYNIGQMYLGHRQYDLARQYFNLVIDGYPQSQEASFAANLIIASFQKELNWAMVQSEARRFIGLALGPDGEVPDDFAKYEQNATLQILVEQNAKAERLMAEGEIEEATRLFNLTADGLQGYLTDYPDLPSEEYANLMLLSGNVYEKGGNIEQANIVYRDFVNRFPGNKASRSILFSIATNHQNALELEEAIKYFDILYKQTYGRGIEYPDAIAALYNSALLKVGLGQYRAAAEGLENYAKKFPEQTDAEIAFFMAGEQWEKVARWRALEFYTRYLAKYKGEDPNNTMIAHYRRIELYREAGNKKREIDREWKKLIQSYEQMLAAGKDSPKMRQYAAEYYLRDIPRRLEEFKSVKYTRNDEKNAGLIQSQLAALKELQEYCAKPGEEFQDLEALIAGRYCAGSAELHMSEFFQNYPIPDNLVPGDEEASFNAQVVFEEQLAKIWEPARESAIVTLEQAIALSEKKGRWTDWTQLALDDLSAMDPKSYPPQKQEVLYPISSVYVAPAGPISMDSPNLIKVKDEGQAETPVNETLPDEGANDETGSLNAGEENNEPGNPSESQSELGWGEAPDVETEGDAAEEDAPQNDDNTDGGDEQ